MIRFLYAVNFEIEMPEVDLGNTGFPYRYYDAAHLANEIKAFNRSYFVNPLFQLMCFSEDADSIEWFLGV